MPPAPAAATYREVGARGVHSRSFVDDNVVRTSTVVVPNMHEHQARPVHVMLPAAARCLVPLLSGEPCPCLRVDTKFVEPGTQRALARGSESRRGDAHRLVELLGQHLRSENLSPFDPGPRVLEHPRFGTPRVAIGELHSNRHPVCHNM